MTFWIILLTQCLCECVSVGVCPRVACYVANNRYSVFYMPASLVLLVCVKIMWSVCCVLVYINVRYSLVSLSLSINAVRMHNHQWLQNHTIIRENRTMARTHQLLLLLEPVPHLTHNEVADRK